MQNEILRTGPANLQRGIESVGGTLSLSSSVLRFKPHLINANRETVEINVDTIVNVQPVRTRFLGRVPLFDNAFIAVLADRRKYRFTVRNRDKWVDAIRAYLASEHQA